MKTEKETIQDWIKNPGVKPLMGKVLIAKPPSMDNKTTLQGLSMPGDVEGYPIGIIVGMSVHSKLHEEGVKVGDAVSYHNGNRAIVLSATTGTTFDIISDHDCFGTIDHHYDQDDRIQFHSGIGAVLDDRSASQIHADEMSNEAHGDINDPDEHLYRNDIDPDIRYSDDDLGF